MTFKSRRADEGRKSDTPFPGVPKTDVLALPTEMPLRSADVKYLLQGEDPPGTKPWVVLIPPGKNGQAMLALANRSFTVQETDDRMVVSPKLL